MLKGGNIAATVAGMVDDYKTLTNSNAGTGERILAGASLASELLPVSIGDVKDGAKLVDKGIDLLKGADKVDAAVDGTKAAEKAVDVVKSGSKGSLDHRESVESLVKKAADEAQPGERIIRERKIVGHDSKRRPDVQIVDKDGKARKVFEAERHPTWKRNRLREQEYKKLGVENETHPVGRK